MSAFIQLQKLRDNGLQPRDRLIWIGLGLRLQRNNSLVIDPNKLPVAIEFSAVAGLDIILCFRGFDVSYGTLRAVCNALLQSLPNRLQVIDFDYKRIAYLKLGSNP